MADDSAVVPESTDPTPPPAPREAPARRPAPWRGRKRVEKPLDKVLRIRCATDELAKLDARAEASGLSLGAYVRLTVLGSAGPRAVKKPRVESEQLARLLGETGKLRSNVNQIAKWTNTERSPASVAELAQIRADIGAMREALMKALGHGD